jgi:hypothetical protein
MHRLLTSSAKSLIFGDGASVAAEQQLRLCAIETATFELQSAQPQLSAAQVVTPAQRKAFLAGLVAVAVAIILWPKLGSLAVVGLVAAGYAANAIFRGWLFWIGAGDAGPELAAAREEISRGLPI